MNALERFSHRHVRKNLPAFRPGDAVRVHCKIKEGEKERIQIFEGTVMGIRGSGISASFTVRKHTYGVGVERSFPLHTPTIDRIELVTKGKVRRAKLTYLRKRSGKAARIKSQWTEDEATEASEEQESSALNVKETADAASIAQ